MTTPEGTGYLQQKFSTPCSRRCGVAEIMKETLGLRKLALDLASGSSLALVIPFTGGFSHNVTI